MHVKRVELENIKSYAGAVFEFERGTTAITGDNGAGKTTILESIAWTLFDLLSYKKDEFVRRGRKKGSVRVTFESGLDEREYTVYRDTGTGYNVYDPALGLRIADKKDEVTRFLWQHLGVEPGTDLETLFKHAIGVPQGTFTAIFLATAAERKKTFDTLLKVEEYRRGADELKNTERYVEGQISLVSTRIARAEGEIARIDSVEADRAATLEQSDLIKSELALVDAALSEKRTGLIALDQTEERLRSMTSEIQNLRSEKEKADLVRTQRETDLDRSRSAAVLVENVRADAARHSESVARMNELERERDQRQKFRDELAKIEKAEARVSAEQKHLAAEIAKIQDSRSVIESLRPLVSEQDRLERESERLKNEMARSAAAGQHIKSLDEKLERLRRSYREIQAQLAEAREKSRLAAELDKFQVRDSEIVRELANLNAALERDEAFQREIKNGLCPILSEKCLNLKNGQTLEGFVTSQFDEMRSRIAMLRSEHSKNTSALGSAREAEKFLAQLTVLESREREIEEEGKRLKAEKESMDKGTGSQETWESELRRVESELIKLDSPKTRIALLETDVQRESELREQTSVIEKNLERLESDRRMTVEQLEAYKDLDAHWAEATALRDATVEAYRSFVANEALALLLAERESQAAAADTELNAINKRLTRAEAEYQDAGRGYDRDRHLAVRNELSELEKKQVELDTTATVLAKREAELTSEMERLEAIRHSMQDEFREKERLEKVLETTDFIRKTLKEAAPLVARNYVWHVSQEANMMYREITGNAERTLKWTEDYGISLEEGGYDRPFVSLSGGEQMAAALSVRLALLKQLSDIRIAFFDEPTTNMDAERRENLAQQTGQIKHFDQLFVISHDDTFEGYMDHEIRVERELR